MADSILNVVGIKIDPKPAEKGGKQVEKSLDGVRKSALSVKSVLATAFAAVSVSSAIREFAEYDQQLRNVATVAGATESELAKLNRTALDLALGTRFNPQEVAQGMYSLASAGQSVNEQISTLPNVLNLAEAAQADLGVTTELVTSTLAQFGLEADQSGRVVDTFTASIANSATNVPRLQVAMANSGSTAKAMNQEFESSVAVLSLLTTAFGNGEKAGTGYKSLLNQLATNGEKLGISVSDAAGNMRPLVEILDEIKEAGIPATELMKTFGTEAGPSLAVLLEQGSDSILKMRDNLLSNGQAAETAAKQLDTLQGDWDQLMSTISVASIQAVDAIEPVLRVMVQTLNKAIQGLMSFFSVTGGGVDDVYDLAEANGVLLNSLTAISEHQVREQLHQIRDAMAVLKEEIKDETFEMQAFGLSAEEAATRLEKEYSTLELLETQFGTLKGRLTEIVTVNSELEKTNSEVSKSFVKVSKTAQSFIDVLKADNNELKAKIKALDGNKNALIEYAREQAIANAQTDEERELISQLFDEQVKLNDELERGETLRNAINDAQEIFNQLIQDSLKVLNPFLEAETQRQAQREAIQMLYDKELITFDQYVTAQQQITREFNNETNAVRGLGSELRNTETAFGSFFESLENSFKQTWKNIKQDFQNNPLDTTAAIGSLLPGILDSIQNNDSSARALNEIASQIPVPEIQAIASILNTVDQLFGGGLLGTNYETVGTGINVSLAGGSVTGEQFERRERERSLFRGTRRRTRYSDLDGDIESSFNDILSAGIEVGAATAQALGVNFVEALGLSISQEYDKDGNLISSVVTDALGRTYNEGVEAFAERVRAENILAQVFESVSLTGGNTTGLETLVNSYRNDAEELLELSTLLAQAQQDINNGFDLLANGSLTDITAIVEGNIQAGEQMVDTYLRMSQSVNIFDDALGIMNIELLGARDEIVQFATDVASEFGNVAQAQAQWTGIFSNYYTEQELLQRQFEQTTASVADLQNELGTNLTFETFRESFEEALPTLSPSEVANWLRLGNELSLANQLAGELANSGLADAMEALRGLADDLADSQLSLYDRLSQNWQSTNDLISAFDGAAESEQRIIDSLQQRYELEFSFIEQIRSASQSINGMLANTRESIELSLLDDEGQYNYFRERAETLAETLQTMTDPEQISATVAQINDYTNQAYGLLNDGQRQAMAPEFLQFLDDIGLTSDMRLGELENEATNQTEQLLARIEQMQIDNTEAEAANQAQFAYNVQYMRQTVEMMDQVVTQMGQLRFPVDVYYRDGYEVGNL